MSAPHDFVDFTDGAGHRRRIGFQVAEKNVWVMLYDYDVPDPRGGDYTCELAPMPHAKARKIAKLILDNTQEVP